ncbi:MAG: alpha/beta fold hydrolase [Planctomycetales bacterium]|nr:alpha/beta fold hydrolase [Planctomycetales bacterium]
MLHDDSPPTWQAGTRTVLLIHGLAGCHQSGYMVRMARKLNERGIRAFRMDQRGCGAGWKLARRPYHAGRTQDVVAALQFIASQSPRSPTTLIGFSLGGNLALKLAGEVGQGACAGLDSVIAICPPVDLEACSRRIEHPSNRFYQRHLLSALYKLHQQRRRCVAGAAVIQNGRRPRSLRELDDQYIAPTWDFHGAADYYQRSSALPHLAAVEIPTRVLAAGDDPLVPVEQYTRADLSPHVQLHLTRQGGHLGFVGRRGPDPDRRWMDWRLLQWVLEAGPR